MTTGTCEMKTLQFNKQMQYCQSFQIETKYDENIK